MTENPASAEHAAIVDPDTLEETEPNGQPTTEPQPAPETQPEGIRRVMVIAAHPDDPEFGAGATIAKWALSGAKITYVLVTSGDKGSHDRDMRPEAIAEMREREQRDAAAVLGVEDVLFLRHADGIVEANMALRRQLTGVIREHEPHVVMTIDPWRRYQLHPDHRAVGWSALDAVWAAREWNIFAEQIRAGRDPWRVKEVYLFWSDERDHVEDVTDTIELRIQALAQHISQTGKRMDEIRKRVLEGTAEVGKEKGFAHAEAFKLLKFG